LENVWKEAVVLSRHLAGMTEKYLEKPPIKKVGVAVEIITENLLNINLERYL
jgi:hypothetical protein